LCVSNRSRMLRGWD